MLVRVQPGPLDVGEIKFVDMVVQMSRFARMTRRNWTKEEDEIVLSLYRKESAPEIAKRLGRNAGMVYQRADKLNLMRRNNFVRDDELMRLICKWHPLGWSDNEISEEASKLHGLPVDRHRTGRLRRELGLSANTLSEHRRERVRDRTAGQLRHAGMKSLAELRIKKWDNWKQSLGWPCNLTVRSVQALEIFWQLRGMPLTRRKLCQLMGVSSAKRHAPISNKGGSVLAELVTAGFVVRIPKGLPIRGQGKGRSQDVYLLQDGVKPDGSRTQT